MTQPEAYEDSRDSASLTSRLRHVYWIGGASGSGKSTIARRLADRHGLRLDRRTRLWATMRIDGCPRTVRTWPSS